MKGSRSKNEKRRVETTGEEVLREDLVGGGVALVFGRDPRVSGTLGDGVGTREFSSGRRGGGMI